MSCAGQAAAQVQAQDEDYITIGGEPPPSVAQGVAATSRIIIPINQAGVIAGTVAASIGYSIGLAMTEAAAQGAGLAVTGVGIAAETVVSLVAGPAAAAAVATIRHVAASAATRGISAYGPIGAVVAGSVLGTTVALTASAGAAIGGLAVRGGKKLVVAAASAMTATVAPETPTVEHKDGGGSQDNNAEAGQSNSIGYGDDGSAREGTRLREDVCSMGDLPLQVGATSTGSICSI
jgi:hypothetical protein